MVSLPAKRYRVVTGINAEESIMVTPKMFDLNPSPMNYDWPPREHPIKEFQARYTGSCSIGEHTIEIGDTVVIEDGSMVCIDCYVPTPPDGPVRQTKGREVMPRGRSARDKCQRCFQIPASNGVCGCE